MDASRRAISPLRQRMIDDMRMCKLSPKTQLQYIRAVKKLTGFVGRSPDTVTVEDLRRYQLHLVDHGTSPVSINAAITGLKFFFEVTLDRGDLISKMRPLRVPLFGKARFVVFPSAGSTRPVKPHCTPRARA